MSNNGTPLVNVTIDDILSLTSSGSYGKAIGNSLYGINHRQTPSAVPMNKDQYGLVFFTRPQLNFTSDNLRALRKFTPLLTTNEHSLQRAIRCTLDPRLTAGFDELPTYQCPFIDPQQAFIPLFTNHCTTITGWQDMEVPFHTEKEGAYKESYTMVDGIVDNYTTYTLTANFRNMRGDPITNMFYYWAIYMAAVFEGTMVPYPDYLVQNILDYTTRVYRLILNPAKTHVQGICASGASIPASVPFGNKFDFSIDKPYNDANATISVPFQSMGIIYNDPILVRQFNATVKTFNFSMRDGQRENDMVKVPMSVIHLFNHRGYPRIDPVTMELQWWMPKEDFNKTLLALKSVEKVIDLDTVPNTAGTYI